MRRPLINTSHILFNEITSYLFAGNRFIKNGTINCSKHTNITTIFDDHLTPASRKIGRGVVEDIDEVDEGNFSLRGIRNRS